MSLANKVALITGGTKGIGAATAQILVSKGAKVVVNYGRDSAAASDLVSKLGGSSNILAVQADAGSLPEIEKLVKCTVEHFGKIDILIPNAGILSMKTVENTSEQDFDRIFNLNVKGPYFLIQKAIPHMSSGSRIVMLSTTQNFASTVSAPYTLYCATKGAIDQMVRTMAKDLASKGISVNACAPGPTGTDLFLEGKSEQILKTIAGLNPFNKIGSPDDVAELIVFLSSPEAAWVNGQTVKANGGQA